MQPTQLASHCYLRTVSSRIPLPLLRGWLGGVWLPSARYSDETPICKDCLVEIQDLGARMKARRTAAGETIAAVAVRAGLSVPYIANLENGRGNPTLTALTALAKAL